MKQDILELLNKILDSNDLSREIKEDLLRYYMLPKPQTEVNYSGPAPIEKAESRVGAIHRPDKKDIDMKNNPKLREENEAMKETLDEIL